MDVYEYCLVEVYISRAEYPPKSGDPGETDNNPNSWANWFKNSSVVVSIEKEKVEYFRIKDELIASRNDIPTVTHLYFKESPTKYILPYLNNLGKEGWEVVEYKASEVDNFGQALLKRKVQKD